MPKIEILKDRILALSQSTDWGSVVKEWTLHDVYYPESPEQCLCTHSPIMEVCVIHNHVTGEHAEIGNVCIKQFLGKDTSAIFRGVKKITLDSSAAASTATLEWAFSKGWLDDYQYNFYKNTRLSRSLSDRQLKLRRLANRDILAGFQAAGQNTH